jgi:hypothetical protein
VLEERVGRPRAVAHRIDIGQAISLAAAVQVARALPETEIFLAPLPAQVVIDALVPPSEIIGLGRPVARRRSPLSS